MAPGVVWPVGCDVKGEGGRSSNEFSPVPCLGKHLHGRLRDTCPRDLPLETYKMWCRYVNNVLVVWSYRDQRLEEFHLHFNGQNPSIQFTLEKELEGRIAFLDAQLERRGVGIQLQSFAKDTYGPTPQF